MNLYPLGRYGSWLACKFFGSMEIIGRKNIPAKGGAMLCGNHVSYFDPPAMGGGASRPVHFMAKIELFQAPVFGWFMSHIEAFPVKRGTADRAALKTAIEYLKAGEVVGMFPEGQRTLDGKLKEAEAGVGMIALKAQVPVIPVGIVNTEKLLPPHAAFPKFNHIKVVFGEPVKLDDLYGQNGREVVEEVGRRIMAAIGELLEKHRDSASA